LDNDSDSDLEDSGSSKSGVHSVSSSSSTSSEDEDINSTVPLGDTWEKEFDFQPSDPNPTQQFEEHFIATRRSQQQRMGLQRSNIEVSTLLRAWRKIFTNSLLDKIVKGWNVGVTGTWFIACQMTATTLSLMSAVAEAWEVSFEFQGQYQ
jgi:hypothetical protein